MRILALTNLFPNPYQPHRAAFNRQHLRILGTRHAVHVIAPIAWTDELVARRRGGDRLPEGRRVTLDGLTVDHPRYLFTPKVLRSHYGNFYLRSVRRTFERVVDEFRPDIIYTPWAYPDGWAAVELGRQAQLPVVLKVHGSDILLLDQHPKRRGSTAEALRQADAVVAVSQDLADRVVALSTAPERVRVVYDGADTQLFHPGSMSEARARLGLDPSTPILLCIGNLVPVKGQDTLIDACAKLARGGVNFTAYLIGQGPLRSNLERQAARLGLGDQFQLLGALPHHQLPDWYRASQVFALPSHSEGVPNVLLEAAACNTPFVASRVGGIPEISDLVPCQLVLPGDATALARALGPYLMATENPNRSAIKPTRDISETAADLEQLFDEVIREYRRRSVA